MRRRHALSTIGYIKGNKGCRKVSYTHEMALQKAEEHNVRYVCGDMGAYKCQHHDAWHIGHTSRTKLADDRLVEHVKWFEKWGEKHNLHAVKDI